jgi:type IV secretion system protein VirB2
MIQLFKKKVGLVNTALLSILCSIPSMSHAATVESILKGAATYLTGTVAKSAGILAIIGMGYLCVYTQKFPKEYFIWTLVGLGIVFGGSQLYQVVVR